MILWKAASIDKVIEMYCGIDVSKNKSNVCILDDNKQVVREFSIEHTKEGFQELEKSLSTDAVIGLEVTSNYCKTIYNYLKPNFNIVYVDNNQMHNFAKLHFSYLKNDTVDARLIALYLTFDFKKVKHLEFDELKDLSRLYYKIRKQLVRYKCMFLGQVNIIFPELETHCFLKNSTVIASMLMRYPSPESIAQAPTEDIHKTLTEKLTRGSRFTMDYAEKLKDLARNSIGVKNYPVACFKSTIKVMLFYQELIKEIKLDMEKSVMKTQSAASFSLKR